VFLVYFLLFVLSNGARVRVRSDLLCVEWDAMLLVRSSRCVVNCRAVKHTRSASCFVGVDRPLRRRCITTVT